MGMGALQCMHALEIKIRLKLEGSSAGSTNGGFRARLGS